MPLLSQFPDKVGRHTLLLLCLIATMVGLPLLEDLPIGRILLSAWFLLTSGVVLASLSGTGRGHRILIVAGAIFCAMLLGNLVVEAMGRDSQALQMIALPYGVLFLAWVSAQAYMVETRGSGDEAGLIISVLRELVQPFRW